MSADTPKRWLGQALAQPACERVWSAAARFDAVLTTAAMDENAKGAWCRANGVCLKDLNAWRQSATQALASPEEERASPNRCRKDAGIEGVVRALRASRSRSIESMHRCPTQDVRK